MLLDPSTHCHEDAVGRGLRLLGEFQGIDEAGAPCRLRKGRNTVVVKTHQRGEELDLMAWQSAASKEAPVRQIKAA